MRNRGVDALVTCHIDGLLSSLADARFDVLTQTADYDAMRLAGRPANAIDVGPMYLTMGSRLRRALTHIPRYRPRGSVGWDDARESVYGADAVIATGGDLFSSTYGYLNTYLSPLKLAIDRGIPIALSAQSIGPFERSEEIDSFLRVARHARVITVRERFSYEYATRNLGLPPEQIELVADPAVMLPAAPTGDALLAHYGLPPGRPFVAVAPSQAISDWGNADRAAHASALRAVVVEILERFDADVILVPHVDSTYAQNMDAVCAMTLLRDLNFNPRVRVACGEHTPSEYKAIIARADMVIAERMHAAIAAFSSGACALCVGYSVKARGIVDGFLGEGAAAEGWVVPVADFSDPTEAVRRVRWAWDRRVETGDRLRLRLPSVRRLAEHNFDVLARRLGFPATRERTVHGGSGGGEGAPRSGPRARNASAELEGDRAAPLSSVAGQRNAIAT
jgi:colanic acid/amylovoran biosynthesis protein